MKQEKIPPQVAKQIDEWCRDTWLSLYRVHPIHVVMRSIFYQGFQLGAKSARDFLEKTDEQIP